jgi:hypothetical protein
VAVAGEYGHRDSVPVAVFVLATASASASASAAAAVYVPAFVSAFRMFRGSREAQKLLGQKATTG